MPPRRLASRPSTMRDFDVRRRFYREEVERRQQPPVAFVPPPLCQSKKDGAPCIHIAGPFHGNTHHDIADREWTDATQDQP